jgi:membrane-bound lytic murein transglycosylase D
VRTRVSTSPGLSWVPTGLARTLAMGAVAALSLGVAKASAEERAKATPAKATSAAEGAGPRAGSGKRSTAAGAEKGAVAKTPTNADEKKKPAEATSVAKGSGDKAKLPTHRRGKAPKTPSAELPAGVPKPEPDAAARKQISGSAPKEDVRTGDPELMALHRAEEVLFPKPLPGIKQGWSWDLPERVESSGPVIEDSGLPPSLGVTPTQKPSADDLERDAEWLKSLSLPDLPVRFDPRVVRYLRFYRDTTQGRSIGRAWVKKSGRYAPAIKAELAKNGMPTDLVWLSLVESGHNPTIQSPAGAAGLWQFIPESARLYGLVVDRWVDERLNPERSTQAALRYLGDLKKRFGTWELAMAAYNMGHGGLIRAIRKFNSNDFWELSRYEAGIPWETTLYVPRILAIAIVMNNPKAFGLSDVRPDPRENFDTVLVQPGQSLDVVATASELPVEQIRGMNPLYLAGRTPPSLTQTAPLWAVRVPSGKGVVTTTKLAVLGKRDPDVMPFVARFGDTADSIARTVGAETTRVQKLNSLGDEERVRVGTVVLVPRSPSGALPRAPEVVVAPPRQFQYKDRRRVFYQTLEADALDEIAAAFGVSAAEIVAWNALDTLANLQSGMVLQIFARNETNLERVNYTAESDTKVLVSGSPEFHDYFEGLKGNKRIVVQARGGDTLSSIGVRYGMSVGWMERVNRRSRDEKLAAGETVVVYTKRDAPGAEDITPLPVVIAPKPEALPPLPTADVTAASAAPTQTAPAQAKSVD